MGGYHYQTGVLSDIARLLAQRDPDRAVGLTYRLPEFREPARRRNVFFSFHFKDLFRVNNVRGAFASNSPYSPHFVDRSIWDRSKAEGLDGIRRVIREGMVGSSVVCVLVGSETWSRPWVRYEIARSVIDGKGLVAVHINGIRHHLTGEVNARGRNPLDFMGVAQGYDGKFYLAERRGNGWFPYDGYANSISLPPYLDAPPPGFVQPLRTGALEWDYLLQNGRHSIGEWLDVAAKAVGR